MNPKHRLKSIGMLRYLALKRDIMRVNSDPRTDQEVVSEHFLGYKGRLPQLINPTHYDDKLAYVMIRDESRLKTICSDKIEVRKYVENRGHSHILIQPFFAFNSTSEIDFSSFVEPMIIKCNHISGDSVIFYPGNRPDKWALKCLDAKLSLNYYLVNRERNYKNIRPRILAERMLVSRSGSVLSDYKFFCFDGTVLFMTIDTGIINEKGEQNEKYNRNFFDRSYNPMPEASNYGRIPLDWRLLPKPGKWGEMVQVAEDLSSPFNHCRVDLYWVDDAIYFGEITFYHGAGLNSFSPDALEKKMASLVDISAPFDEDRV